MSLKTISEQTVFGGTIGYYSHASEACSCDMRYSVFTPGDPAAKHFPVVFWLSGLTCTEDNFTVKAGAYREASALGLMIVAPDTSPRGPDVPDDDAYDLGQGAGFYLDATEAPWADHFQMASYVTRDLQDSVFSNFPADPDRQGIMGHSMGGHGALTLGLKHAELYRSVSAIAPISAPVQCPWGRKAFTAYLGSDEQSWKDHDACELMRASGSRSDRPPILVDQGLDDPFLEEQLQPGLFEQACEAVGQPLTLRLHEGYDHSYFFIATIIDDHLRHHAKIQNSR